MTSLVLGRQEERPCLVQPVLVRPIQVRGNLFARDLDLGELVTDGLQDGVPRLDGWKETVHVPLVDATAVVDRECQPPAWDTYKATRHPVGTVQLLGMGRDALPDAGAQAVELLVQVCLQLGPLLVTLLADLGRKVQGRDVRNLERSLRIRMQRIQGIGGIPCLALSWSRPPCSR